MTWDQALVWIVMPIVGAIVISGLRVSRRRRPLDL
jgi:hypothetical protein